MRAPALPLHTLPGLNLVLSLLGWLPVKGCSRCLCCAALHGSCPGLRHDGQPHRAVASWPGGAGDIRLLPACALVQGVVHAFWVLCTRNPLAGERRGLLRPLMPLPLKVISAARAGLCCPPSDNCPLQQLITSVLHLKPNRCHADEDWAGYAALTRPAGKGGGFV